MEQNLLNEFQIKAIKLIASEPKFKNFYLSGGTALTQYYFHHRISDDLDFFTIDENIDLVFIHSFVEKLKNILKAKEVIFSRLYDRNQFFFNFNNGETKNELKIEFTKYPFTQLEIMQIFDNINVDSLRDVSANKLMAMLDRFDPKDFVDLFFILQKFKLDEICFDVEKKFGTKIDSIFLGSELLKARRITVLPKMVKVLQLNDLKNFFEELALKLAPNVFE